MADLYHRVDNLTTLRDDIIACELGPGLWL
jgi:hypothetical protein